MKIKIPQNVLKHPNAYLFNGEQYDFLGCILCELGYIIPPKTKFPSDLGILIPNFTLKIKNKIVDSSLSIEIQRLEPYPRKEALVIINKLLEPVGITVSL